MTTETCPDCYVFKPEMEEAARRVIKAGVSHKWFFAECDVGVHKPVDFKYQHLNYPGLFTFR